MLEEDESYLLWRKQAIELHSDEGTHRLELPVSRTTLKVWGGVPREISEKSVESQSEGVLSWWESSRMMLTLSVHEVVDQHIMTTAGLHRGVLEALSWAIAHVLLAQSLNMGVDVVSVLWRG